MSAAAPDLSRLAELMGTLGLHKHFCHIYATQEEQFAAAVPYLQTSLERRERCLYVADENTAAALLGALRRGGIDVDGFLQSGALSIVRKEESYLANDRFDPDSWIRFLSQAVAAEGKFAGIRTLLGEMTWSIKAEITGNILIEYEAKLNRFVRDHDIRVLCQYHRNRFSPEVLLTVLRTHSTVLYCGIVSLNPYYVPPGELLKPDQPSEEIERLLNNILKTQHSLDQLRALAIRLLTVQETERKYLARELHDEIGQVLTGLRLLLKPDRQLTAGALKARLEQARTVVDDLLAKVKHLSFDLRPADLDVLGLLPALFALFERYQAQTGIRVNIDRQGMDIRFPPAVETAAYRIVQEALTNAARHAGVADVTVRYWADADTLTLQVEDKGRGFDPELALKSAGTRGLAGIQERTSLLDGRLKVDSAPGAGSRITVELPIGTTAEA
jgi:signal transduction histidine kinase